VEPSYNEPTVECLVLISQPYIIGHASLLELCHNQYFGCEIIIWSIIYFLDPIKIFVKKILSNSHFEKISLWVIVQHFENIYKGSRRRFLLKCNQYFFHRSLNTPTPVELCLSTGGNGDRFNCGSLLGLSVNELQG